MEVGKIGIKNANWCILTLLIRCFRKLELLRNFLKRGCLVVHSAAIWNDVLEVETAEKRALREKPILPSFTSQSFTRRTPYFYALSLFSLVQFRLCRYINSVEIEWHRKTHHSGRIIWTLWGYFTLKSSWIYMIRSVNIIWTQKGCVYLLNYP